MLEQWAPATPRYLDWLQRAIGNCVRALVARSSLRYCDYCVWFRFRNRAEESPERRWDFETDSKKFKGMKESEMCKQPSSR
jgi:hypothetical protein